MIRWLTYFLILGIFPSVAQDGTNNIKNDTFQNPHELPINPNAIDDQGRKTGKWTILFDENWNEIEDIGEATYYRLITYQEGKPKGKMGDYYRSGQIQMEGIVISELRILGKTELM